MWYPLSIKYNSPMITYIHVYAQPLIVLLVGFAILAFVGYKNWSGDIKQNSARWIARHIFSDGDRSDISADNLFMHITTITLIVGIMWVGLALGYLFN
jgi:hypothetical protein